MSAKSQVVGLTVGRETANAVPQVMVDRAVGCASKATKGRRRCHPRATCRAPNQPAVSRGRSPARRHFWAVACQFGWQKYAVAGTPARGLQEVVPGTHRVGEDSAARRRRRSALCCPLPLPRSRSGCSAPACFLRPGMAHFAADATRSRRGRAYQRLRSNTAGRRPTGV